MLCGNFYDITALWVKVMVTYPDKFGHEKCSKWPMNWNIIDEPQQKAPAKPPKNWDIVDEPITTKKPKKVSKGATIRNRYNQVPHLTQDTNGKVTNSQLDTTNKSNKQFEF